MQTDPQSRPRTTDAPPSEQPLRPPEVAGGVPPVAGKADLTKRAVACVIDAVAAFAVGMVPFIGGIAGAAYWLVRDGLDVEFMPNRSLGKKLVGLQPVTFPDGRKLDLETSVKRNWPFVFGGIAQALAYIPIIGWLLIFPVALVALGVGIVEIYLVVTTDDGRRMGDKFAGTHVIEVAGG